MGDGDEDARLASATRCSLEVAAENGLKSVAFPAISTGIFGFPVARAATIMLQETGAFLRRRSSLETVVFCLFSDDDFQVFAAALPAAGPGC